MFYKLSDGKDDGYRAKICIEMIVKYLRYIDKNNKDYNISVKDVKLIEFQKWVGRKLTINDL